MYLQNYLAFATFKSYVSNFCNIEPKPKKSPNQEIIFLYEFKKMTRFNATKSFFEKKNTKNFDGKKSDLHFFLTLLLQICLVRKTCFFNWTKMYERVNNTSIFPTL